MAKRKNRNINIADSGALSDLAFLLIIFFIVIAVFNINHGFILNLPKKNSTRIVNTDDIFKVYLEDDGRILAGSEEVTVEELENRVKENLDYQPNMTLLLKIDPEVKYQHVVDIVQIIRNLDVENFSFTMTGADGGGD